MLGQGRDEDAFAVTFRRHQDRVAVQFAIQLDCRNDGQTAGIEFWRETHGTNAHWSHCDDRHCCGNSLAPRGQTVRRRCAGARCLKDEHWRHQRQQMALIAHRHNNADENPGRKRQRCQGGAG
jgi:hypothetical protein